MARHTAELHIELRTAGNVTLRISDAPTKVLLEWLEPIIAYLRDSIAEEERIVAMGRAHNPTDTVSA